MEESYSNLIKATEEIALEILPKKQKRKRHEPENSLQVNHAREKLSKISSEYHKSPSFSKRGKLISAKKEMDAAYLSAEANYINGKIENISHLHISRNTS